MHCTFSFYSKSGIGKVMNTLAKKYENCPDCSIEYNTEKIANKVMKENYIAVMVCIFNLFIIFLGNLFQIECFIFKEHFTSLVHHQQVFS
jgi:hypothetical protein